MNTLLKKHAENLKKNKKGFTLVELIIVLVILAILAAVAVPSMLHYVNEARDKTNISDARNAYTAAQFIATDIVSAAAGRTVNGDKILDGTTVLIANTVEAPATNKTWGDAIAPYTDNVTKGGTITVKLADGTNNTIAGQVTELTYTIDNKTVTIVPGKEPTVVKVTAGA